MSRNPFEKYGIDPRLGPRGITERMRELVEDARSDGERQKLRAVWEELTLHPGKRVRAAILAHPDTRTELGAPPPLAPRHPPAGAVAIDVQTITLADLAVRPSVAAVLATASGAADELLGEESLSQDPTLSLE